MKRAWAMLAVILLFAGLASCGGGGGGGGGAPLSPPAFTNLAGTRWNQIETVSAPNSCGAGIGITFSFVLHVLAQSGNTISIYDETHAAALDAQNATISGSVVTFSGEHYPISCSNMTISSSVTLNSSGTAYSGTGTVTCLDAPACSVPITISGTKI